MDPQAVLDMQDETEPATKTCKLVLNNLSEEVARALIAVLGTKANGLLTVITITEEEEVVKTEKHTFAGGQIYKVQP